jgi:hypothetical protein
MLTQGHGETLREKAGKGSFTGQLEIVFEIKPVREMEWHVEAFIPNPGSAGHGKARMNTWS